MYAIVSQSSCNFCVKNTGTSLQHGACRRGGFVFPLFKSPKNFRKFKDDATLSGFMLRAMNLLGLLSGGSSTRCTPINCVRM